MEEPFALPVGETSWKFPQFGIRFSMFQCAELLLNVSLFVLVHTIPDDLCFLHLRLTLASPQPSDELCLGGVAPTFESEFSEFRFA